MEEFEPKREINSGLKFNANEARMVANNMAKRGITNKSKYIRWLIKEDHNRLNKKGEKDV